ncbi:hypothetical protein SXCC_03538 [Gluconacetobacter sp. SXCC-1]|nr:hypothetical protein SXCC_03538 [Gluconacetobacter sp. SXCC-1]
MPPRCSIGRNDVDRCRQPRHAFTELSLIQHDLVLSSRDRSKRAPADILRAARKFLVFLYQAMPPFRGRVASGNFHECLPARCFQTRAQKS